MTLGHNGFVQQSEDAAASVLGRNGFVQPTDGSGLDRGAAVTGSNVVLPNNDSNAVLNFDTEVYDVGDFWTVGSPPRFTAPETGKYLVWASGTWAANPTGYRRLSIRANGGGTLWGTSTVAAISGVTVAQNVFAEVYLAAGEYVEFLGFQNSGGSLTISVATAGIRKADKGG